MILPILITLDNNGKPHLSPKVPLNQWIFHSLPSVHLYILQYVCSNENSVDLSFQLSTFKAWTLRNNFHVGCIWYSYWHPSAQYKPIYRHNGTPHLSQHMAQQRHCEFCLRREIHINASFPMIHRLPCLVHVGSSANCKALPNFGWLDQFWCGWSKLKHPKNRLRNP